MIRIFVGGLPLTAVKEDVVKLFKQFGATEEGTVLPRDRRTRRKKGYAYVMLPTNEAAAQAIAVFNGFPIGAKELTVTRAEDRPLRKGRPPRPAGPPRTGMPPRPPTPPPPANG